MIATVTMGGKALPDASVVFSARRTFGALPLGEDKTLDDGTAAVPVLEREVLNLLVQGVTSTRELAERLVVSENTVKYHLRNILDKLHVQNRAQVVAYAVRHGMVGNSHPEG